MELASAVGWVAAACGLLLFGSPAPTFQQIARQGDVGGLHPMPYLVGLLQCLIGASYGAIAPDKLVVLVSNGCGVFAQLVWCCHFIRFSKRKADFCSNLLAVVSTWLLVTALDLLIFKHLAFRPWEGSQSTLEAEVMGLVVILLSLAMFAVSVTITAQAIRTRSVENLPIAVIIMTLVTCSCWVVYSVLARDPWCLIPNACGVGLAAAQALIYATFRKAPTSDGHLPCKSYAAAAPRDDPLMNSDARR